MCGNSRINVDWNCLESCCNRSVTHSQTCHIQDWQAPSSLSRDITFCSLSSYFEQYLRSVIQICVCLLCSILTLTSGTRAEEGGACLGRKKEGRRACRDLFLWAVRTGLLFSQVSEGTKDCCHGHLVTMPLLGFADNVQRHQVSLAIVFIESCWGTPWN